MARLRSEKQEPEKKLSFEQVISDVIPFLNTPCMLEIQLGQTRMTIRELLELDSGSIVELKKSAGEPMEVICKGRVLMKGEVTVLEDTLGLRIVEMVDSSKRV